ncbi:hypothetical protein DM01DRAFT_323464 [Hesseltinella vesiculosa]|uniref:Uncharacterized protein n=1 Tax=Hesseltinella vesiculosa TaxID=101127 RepID=A0A1X2GWB4_9FUNG|nr:hypothetical protein DM01DRAFT_323464 [Hesseltinella vesiculosa]
MPKQLLLKKSVRAHLKDHHPAPSVAQVVHHLGFETDIVNDSDIQVFYNSSRACDSEIPGLLLHIGKKCGLWDELDQLSRADALGAFAVTHPVQRFLNHRTTPWFGISSTVAE